MSRKAVCGGLRSVVAATAKWFRPAFGFARAAFDETVPPARLGAVAVSKNWAGAAPLGDRAGERSEGRDER